MEVVLLCLTIYFPPLILFHFCQHGSNPANLRLYKAAQASTWVSEDMFVLLSSLAPNPVEWISKIPPASCPQFDLSDPERVRTVLVDFYNLAVAHHQHAALLKTDVCVAKVTSWTVAESMKGAPGIFEDNDTELVKKLKETLQQSDSLLKLGIGGSVYRRGSGGG